MHFKLFILLLTLINSEIYCQSDSAFENQGGSIAQTSNNLGVLTEFSSDNFLQIQKKDLGSTIGSDYIFNNWNLESEIKLKNNSKLQKIKNVNLNTEYNEFVYKSEDDYSVLSKKYIDYISIDNRIFKVFNFNDDFEIFEVLYNNAILDLIKKTKTVFKPAIQNGYNNTQDEYKSTYMFYIFKNNEYFNIKLNKKSILSIFENKEAIITFVKKNKLKYRQEKDVIKIFKFAYNL